LARRRRGSSVGFVRRSLSALIFCALLALPGSASARATQQYAYTYEQLWRAVVRLIAVDFRFPITERDQDNGYVLFEYHEEGRNCAGSLELVRTHDSHGQDRVSIVVSVTEMPSYVERMMLDRLGRKLGEEYGAPPAPRPAPGPARPSEEHRSETHRSSNQSR
jgi:hypothetical protein